jgi:hypothetical protein
MAALSSAVPSILALLVPPSTQGQVVETHFGTSGPTLALLIAIVAGCIVTLILET